MFANTKRFFLKMDDGCGSVKMENSGRQFSMGDSTVAPNQDSKKPQSTPAPNKGASKRHLKKAQASLRSPEEQKLYEENQKKVLEAAQARAALVGNWGATLPRMSHRQLQGELNRVIKGKFLGEPTSPLGIVEAICQSISLRNIKTRDNLAGQLSAFIHPTISADSPRYTP